MRQLQGVLLAGAALFTLASTAVADDLTRDFSGVVRGSVNYTTLPNAGDALNRAATFSEQGGDSINQVLLRSNPVNKGGGNVEALVELGSSTVSFKSGTATVGPNSVTNSQSGIDILFSNTSERAIPLRDFGSTIIPAGMGFFVQDRSGLTPANPFTDYGQSESVKFTDFFGAVGGAAAVGRIFASVEFKFDITANTEGSPLLYTLAGFSNLSFNSDMTLNIQENLTVGDAVGVRFLNDFTTVLNNHHALAYDWKATNIVIPLSDLGALSGGQNFTVSYRTSVTSTIKAPCINKGLNCIVAYAGFGDPIGRGGGDVGADALAFSAFSSGGDIVPFDADGDHEFIIRRLKFEVVEGIKVAGPIPEPSTWAVMIIGFGIAGAALRRRRRVAYT